MSSALTSSVVGSASIWTLGRVAGPRREATVVQGGSDAIYLDLEGSCIAVLAGRAVQVPLGVRTLLPELPSVETGDPATIHDGVVEVEGLSVLVTNIVDTTVPVLSAEDAAWGRMHLPKFAEHHVSYLRDVLPAQAFDQLAEGDAQAAHTLLGEGRGATTPLGDDVLGGWIATAVAIRLPSLQAIRSEVALNAFDRTNLVSASLLACAARGEGVPEFHSAMSGVARQNDDILSQSLDLMFERCGESGMAFVLGSMLAFEAFDPDA
ncbi:oxamate carbamoyltransferase subunit AllH family protein [Nocardioides marmoribigeumensis]|uniref:DUF2877 domain-containing protein n=1 Tax=Nocardioides marmoribigeumensis TaxID=433649 RepID=A0ABU2BTP1_9ACTN|nr:DUF2877 domain-containing protein [Nocardioides marmoribigeumensis]MDR7361656.1 hypothetical protein [Nocardioides marmoribigeumensis]